MIKGEVALVTGAAGFLGSHLCDKLISKGYYVIGMDNLLTGNLDNISHLKGNESFSFIEADVCDFDFSTYYYIKHIFHFASPASPITYLKNPIETLKIGSFGIYNLLELAESNDARLIIASTSEVYGDPHVHPQHEDYYGNVNPVGNRSVYDEAKRFQEAITMAYNRHRGVDTRIVRIFNTYGPRMRLDDGRVIPAFIDQIKNKRPLTIMGDGSQTRSFCYVDDLIEGIYRLMFFSYEHYPVNIGNPQEITVMQIARELLMLAGENPDTYPIEYIHMDKDDPKQRRPDISKAKRVLGWEPKVSREEGLKLTYEYYK